MGAQYLISPILSLTVPQQAAVFHNDCFYVAHHLLSLGHRVKPHLPEDVAAVATFIDMVGKREKGGLGPRKSHIRHSRCPSSGSWAKSALQPC